MEYFICSKTFTEQKDYTSQLICGLTVLSTNETSEWSYRLTE